MKAAFKSFAYLLILQADHFYRKNGRPIDPSTPVKICSAKSFLNLVYLE
jgi:hypothetical protein